MNTGIYHFLGGRIVCSGDSVINSLQTGFLDGTEVVSIESYRYYLMSGNAWNPVSTAGFKTYYNVPSAGLTAQSLIGLSGYSTITGNQELQVFLNGTLMQRDSTPSSRDFDYHLSGCSNTGVRFNFGLPSGALVSFIGFR